MAVLALDLGTTHTKAGLFAADGTLVDLWREPTPTAVDKNGVGCFPAEQYWLTVKRLLQTAAAGDRPIQRIAITSMAETGLLINKDSGRLLTDLIPWYDREAEDQLPKITRVSGERERFFQSGLRLSAKSNLPKLLHLRDQGLDLAGSTWLFADSYIAWKLTGQIAGEHTIAARSYCFDLQERQWDVPWMKEFGLSAAVFPPLVPSGSDVGRVRPEEACAAAITPETTVALAGHDHVAASLGVGVLRPGQAVNSMGTAEVLLGTATKQSLTEEHYAAGLSFGPHYFADHHYWMGGISASGASLEWMRELMSDGSLTYKAIHRLLAAVDAKPTGILYYPYLNGAGAPRPDPKASGALVGFRREHGRGHLLKAVLEGTAYELEGLRRRVETVVGLAAQDIRCVGGGVQNPYWLAIKANVTGCSLKIPDIAEASLLGAVLAAGWRQGEYSTADLERISDSQGRYEVDPQDDLHDCYENVRKQGYEGLQDALRNFYQVQTAIGSR